MYFISALLFTSHLYVSCHMIGLLSHTSVLYRTMAGEWVFCAVCSGLTVPVLLCQGAHSGGSSINCNATDGEERTGVDRLISASSAPKWQKLPQPRSGGLSQMNFDGFTSCCCCNSTLHAVSQNKIVLAKRMVCLIVFFLRLQHPVDLSLDDYM